MNEDFTPEQYLLIEVLEQLCEQQRDDYLEASDAFDRLSDVPAFLRKRMGSAGSLTEAQARVADAERALILRRAEAALWLSRCVGQS